jgi:hypothetical protein
VRSIIESLKPEIMQPTTFTLKDHFHIREEDGQEEEEWSGFVPLAKFEVYTSSRDSHGQWVQIRASSNTQPCTSTSTGPLVLEARLTFRGRTVATHCHRDPSEITIYPGQSQMHGVTPRLGSGSGSIQRSMSILEPFGDHATLSLHVSPASMVEHTEDMGVHSRWIVFEQEERDEDGQGEDTDILGVCRLDLGCYDESYEEETSERITPTLAFHSHHLTGLQIRDLLWLDVGLELTLRPPSKG